MVRQLKRILDELLLFILLLPSRYKNFSTIAYLLDQDATPGELETRLRTLQEQLKTIDHATKLGPPQQ